MNLHGDQKLFSQSIRAASQLLNIREEFIEKDYWITPEFDTCEKRPRLGATIQVTEMEKTLQ